MELNGKENTHATIYHFSELDLIHLKVLSVILMTFVHLFLKHIIEEFTILLIAFLAIIVRLLLTVVLMQTDRSLHFWVPLLCQWFRDCSTRGKFVLKIIFSTFPLFSVFLNSFSTTMPLDTPYDWSNTCSGKVNSMLDKFGNQGANSALCSKS